MFPASNDYSPIENVITITTLMGTVVPKPLTENGKAIQDYGKSSGQFRWLDGPTTLISDPKDHPQLPAHGSAGGEI